jgi:alpha-N-acetylglucosaminidase
MKQKMIDGDRMETADFDESIKEWEWQWVNAHDDYSATPKGNTIEIVNKIFKKYEPRISDMEK